MQRSIIYIAGAALAFAVAVGAAVAQPGHEAAGNDKPVTITGELIDTACFVASDGEAKGKDHAACAQKCMSSGIPAAILPAGSKGSEGLLFLLTNPKPFAAYAAQTIKVEGTQHADMHAIDVKKAYVKDGENWKEIKLDDEHHKMGGGDMKDGASDGHTGHKH